mgnify:CR=1 FL=1|jgi:hemerythrin
MNSSFDINEGTPTDAAAELAFEREAHAGTRARLKLLESKLLNFVPRDMISLLNKGSLFNISLGDQVEKKMAVMFTDMRDFTTLSENMTSQQTFNMLNSYLSMMNPIISAHQGIIDKYIGDAIMVLFPTSSEDALSTALSMLARLKEYNAGRLRAGYRPIQIGIGINTGLLMLGIIGGGNRMEGTVVGRTVNLASRLESFTKIYGTHLLISEYTFCSLADPRRFSIRYLGRVKISEKTPAESIYEVFDYDAPHVKELKTKSLKKFEEAVIYYHSREVARALPILEGIVRENPDDNPAKMYLKRCNDYLETGNYVGAEESFGEVNCSGEYQTGFAEIDHQHQELLAHIRELYEAVMAGKNWGAISATADSLGKHIQVHFEFEEDLMRNHFYPFTSDHIAHHNSYTNNFLELKNDIEAQIENRLFLGLRIHLFLLSRLMNHLTYDDRHLGRFLNECGLLEPDLLP